MLASHVTNVTSALSPSIPISFSLSPVVVLARARVGAKSEEPGGAVVMLGNDGLESVTRQKRTRVLLLE